MTNFEKIIKEMLCEEKDSGHQQSQLAYSLYVRELSSIRAAKNRKEELKSIARMIALSPHLTFEQAKRIASK